MLPTRYDRRCIATLFLLAICPGSVLFGAAAEPKLEESFGRLPLIFEHNTGQVDPRFQFLSRARGYSVFFQGPEAVMTLNGSPAHARLRLKLGGANPLAQAFAVDPLPGKSNYFIGSDPRKWRTDVQHYARIRFRNVYPGVDLTYYGNQRNLEYDFIVSPGGDPNHIQLIFEGADRLRLDGNGDLLLRIAGTEIRQHRPAIHQDINGKRVGIAGAYKIASDGRRVGFSLEPYDISKPLTIDPVLTYNDFLGGIASDQALGVAVDQAGNTYVTGFTESQVFPNTGTQQGSRSSRDAFVIKLNNDGTQVLYKTFLGGAGADTGVRIAIDSASNAIVVGNTSGNFPILNAAQPSFAGGGQDAFVAKINSAGGIVYSTYLGGAAGDNAADVAVDNSDSAYITGSTASTNFKGVSVASLATVQGGPIGAAAK